MSNIFYMISDNHGAWLLDTLSTTRNGTTDKLFGKPRGRLAWHRKYNQGYRIHRMEMKDA